ncbi:MAG: circularly permuted type 2 ATP-grasp protein [Acidobacteria bacterium]|nr:circularly permuted type 2 ATP-grasp protein [Acidobacteriota bacterium]MCA1651509.1 circularly permuted type 2 ATP-grasp protein [Acidobacteriota bacterium]
MDAAGAWHALLRPDEELTARFCAEFSASMRARKLTFGDRIHCPFLRPFFLTEEDEARIRVASETLAAIGERVVRLALYTPTIFDQLGLSEAERRLVRMDPGYATASTASRVDAFLLPDGLTFAEYNAESPAGSGYTQRLCELFDRLPVMGRFKERFSTRFHRPIDGLLEALVASYREWGGRANPPQMAIVDWREVPTWTEFEILRDAFAAAGIPAIICDPRDLEFHDGALTAHGQRIDLVYRRVLLNDIVARADDCAMLVRAYEARAVCVANTFQCKLAHKKAFFAVLTDPANVTLFSGEERSVIQAHVPWTRVLADGATEKDGRTTSLLELAVRERDRLVLKPNDEYGGKGVLLGWETSHPAWSSAIDAALLDPPGTWIIQERIPIRRETFPQFDADGRVTMRDVLVDLAPYLFRGRLGGYLTRLSASGLANVTSGGGQVPPFIVSG